MVFEIKHKVVPDEIDGLGHVNNVVYLKWFMDIAEEHSKALGWPLSKMIERGEGWVVKKHELNYLVSVMPGDTIKIRTWIESHKRASCVRKYEIIRLSDDKKMCAGSTAWVWLNYKTGKISPMPPEIIPAFENSGK